MSEFEQAELAATASEAVRPPRVAAASISMEAKLSQIVPVEGTSYTMILGRVVRFHVREGLIRPNGLVDARLLDPVARLGGDEYTSFGDVFEMLRPRV